MVDWEKGEHYERAKWENKIKVLLNEIEQDEELVYNKDKVISLIKIHLLKEGGK